MGLYPEVCKQMARSLAGRARGRVRRCSEMLAKKSLELGERTDPRSAAGLHPVVLAGELYELDGFVSSRKRSRHELRLRDRDHGVVLPMNQQHGRAHTIGESRGGLFDHV